MHLQVSRKKLTTDFTDGTDFTARTRKSVLSVLSVVNSVFGCDCNDLAFDRVRSFRRLVC